MTATPFETYKAQADVLVPVVRALIDELGRERAQKLVSDALGDHFRNFGKAAIAAVPGADFGEKLHTIVDMFAQGDALEWTVEHQGPDGLDFRVDKCAYAEMYKALEAPELGFLLVCTQDYPLTEGLDEGAVLRRPLTIMQGADHCQFSWRRTDDPAEVSAERGAEQVHAEAEQRRLFERTGTGSA